MCDIDAFKKKRNALSEDEIQSEIKSLCILRGRYQEAHFHNLAEKNYQRTYRDENRERIRAYHCEYARKRRARMRTDERV
tara:strand:+ start:157 stop:396 length:240 start_codon:yes stop_codon:yes gene_type:complete